MSSLNQISAFILKTLGIAGISLTDMEILITDVVSGQILFQEKRAGKDRFTNYVKDVNSQKDNPQILPATTYISDGNNADDRGSWINQIITMNDKSIEIRLSIEVEDLRSMALTKAIVASIFQYLSHCNTFDENNIDPNELCSRAAQTLLSEYLYSEDCVNFELFYILGKISIARYEGRTAIGTIVYNYDTSTYDSASIKLKYPVPISNITGVRKLLEVGQNEYYLMATNNHISELKEKRSLSAIYSGVDFVSDNSWVLTANNSKLLKVKAGHVTLFNEKLDKVLFTNALTSEFPKLEESRVNLLFNLVNSVAVYHNGSNLLIASNARHIAERLQSQCTLIEPVPLNEDIIKYISGIDGTVIMDTDGVCWGFGAILDGAVANSGNSARGGRYNSAVMFCEHSTSPCLIVVISQDNSVDIITTGRHN